MEDREFEWSVCTECGMPDYDCYRTAADLMQLCCGECHHVPMYPDDD
jgi:hypothetical protein